MRTFSKFMESVSREQELLQLMQRQQAEMDKAEGNPKLMMQLSDRHAEEMKEFQAQTAALRSGLAPRNPVQKPSEFDVDAIVNSIIRRK